MVITTTGGGGGGEGVTGDAFTSSEGEGTKQGFC